MVTVKFYGLLRLDSGVRSLTVEADSVKELYGAIVAELRRTRPDVSLTEKDLKSCTVSVNGERCTGKTRLHDGDTAVFLPAAAGG